jgi:hypothetical protein
MATEPRGILVPAYDRPGHPTRSDGAIEPTNGTTRPNCGPHGARGSEQDCHSANTDLSSITRDRTEIGRPALPNLALLDQGGATRRARSACPRFAAGRYAGGAHMSSKSVAR